jgi:hypothetical protein
VRETLGNHYGPRRFLSAVLKNVAPYLATPLRVLARELRREGCAVILCQEYEYARFDACVLLGRLMRLPVFATFQGGDSQMSRLESPLRPLALRACAGLVVATQTEAERVHARYHLPPHKLARIFNPIDLFMWDPVDRGQARAALGIPLNCRVVMCHVCIDIYHN